jgi:hypothetical protein
MYLSSEGTGHRACRLSPSARDRLALSSRFAVKGKRLGSTQRPIPDIDREEGHTLQILRRQSAVSRSIPIGYLLSGGEAILQRSLRWPVVVLRGPAAYRDASTACGRVF